MDNRIYLQAEYDHDSKWNTIKMMRLIIKSKFLVDIINYIVKEVSS